jgi:hypothetical protein
VKPETQWYLVEALSHARAGLGVRDDYEAKQTGLSSFRGALAAFRYMGEITQDEENAWFRKMLVALGYELPDPAPPGVAQAIYVGDPAKRPAPLPTPPSAPIFIRSQPGPDEEFEFHGGRLRVIAVEFYDSSVLVRWRFSPEPEITSVFLEEAATLEEDLEGLEDWAKKELRRKDQQNLKRMRLYKFGLTDDIGTAYISTTSGRHGGPGEMSGETRFQPVPPAAASLLTFSWLGLEVPIPVD